MGIEESVRMYARMHPGISREDLDAFRRDIKGYETDRAAKSPVQSQEQKWLRDLMRRPVDDYLTTDVIPARATGRRR